MSSHILETDRLILKPFNDGDLDFFISMKTDSEIMKYTPPALTEAQVRADLPKRLGESVWDGETGERIIWLKETSQPIGSIGFFVLPENDPDLEEGTFVSTGEIEIGYRSIVSSWGNGYITEAASVALDFAFNNGDLSKIVACTHLDNEASKNILKKIGLKDLGSRRCYGLDLPYFEVTRDEWRIEREAS